MLRLIPLTIITLSLHIWLVQTTGYAFASKSADVYCDVQAVVLKSDERQIKNNPWSTEEMTNVWMEVDVIKATPLDKNERAQKIYCRRLMKKETSEIQSIRDINFVDSSADIKAGTVIEGRLKKVKKSADLMEDLHIIYE